MNKGERLFPNKNYRKVFTDKDLGLNEIPIMGMHCARSAAVGLSEHSHPRSIEICYMKSGMQVFCVGDKEYQVRGGDLFITHPGIVHGNGPNPYGRCVLYWIQFQIKPLKSKFLLLPGQESEVLKNSLLSIPNGRFRGNLKIEKGFESIFRYAEKRTDTELRNIFLRSALIQWLLEIIECYDSDAAAPYSQDIVKVMEVIGSNPAENLTIEEMAAKIYLSPSRFIAKFKSETGYTPREYQLRKKIEQAREMLLADNFRITDIAYQLGFSSSQHFATAFKKIEHASPTQFRNSNRAK